ncbi:MAG: hypothetical protein AAGA23_10275 [Pseudomonadota bacterium]
MTMRANAKPLLGILLAPSLALAGGAPLVTDGPAPDAPEQVVQYGQLEGHWSCMGSSKQPDGTWQEAPSPATWSWYYVLGGHAVQDVWQPAPPAAIGTNLRTYDAEQDQWNMVWATQTQAQFDHYTARFEDGRIVMRGEVPARARPAHAAKITFYNISKKHFDWKFEATSPGTDQGWAEFSRLSCDRLS